MPSLPNISPELIQAYQDQISKSSSSATVKRKSIALNRFFDWAEEAGHIPQNPLQQVQSLQPEIQRVSKSKRKIEASSRTYAVIGLTVALIILLFLLTWKLKFPISFIQNFAQVNNTGEVQNVAQNVSPIPATPAANLAWNLYAKLKLTDSNGIPEVGSQSLSFNLYNSETGGSPVYTSSTQIVTTDTNGSALISIDNVPSDLFFQNNTLYLEPNFNNQGTSTARIPISTANTAANLEGYFPANPETGANSEEIPVINSDGSLLLASQSPMVKATQGNLQIEGQAVVIKASDGSGGNIVINPDANGYAKFLFEGNKGNFLNATANNLTSGSLYYGVVQNNATGYYLINLQSGSTPTTKFSVDSVGNTNITGDLSTGGTDRLTATGSLQNITGYSQTSGNLTVSQNAGDYASITKNDTALSDVMDLTLNENNIAGSHYSTLVLNRYGGDDNSRALLVNSGNAQFNGQVQLGGYTSLPTAIGQGSLVFNTSDSKVYVWNGTSWVAVGSGGGGGPSSFDQIISGTNTSATMVVGSGASLGFTGTGTITASGLSCSGCVSNSQLTNSSLTINTGGILTGGGSIALGGTLNLTATEADTLDSVTGRGATTTNAISVGNLTSSGTTTFGGIAYTWPGSQVTSGFLQTDGSGGLSWTTSVPVSSMAFSGLTSGTNTSAAMVVGSGASLDYTGSGTINASSLEGSTWESPGTIGLTTPNSGAFTILSASSYATVSGSLALGTANASAGPGNLDMSGNLVAAGNITGTTLNGTTGINTGVGAGTARIDSTGNLTNIDTTQFNTQTYTWPGSQVASGFLQTDGTGGLSWITSVAATSVPFSGITDGTNISASMVVGNGASLSYTGTGTIDASSLEGATWEAPGIIGITTPAGGNFTSIGATTQGTGAFTTLSASSYATVSGSLALGSSNASAGPGNLDMSGNLTVGGTTTLGGQTYTWPGIGGTNGQALTTDGSGNLAWNDVLTSATVFWTELNGLIYPKNSSEDVAIGGNSTSSAKFAFTGVDGGLPTASIAGTAANVATYLTGNGNLATTNMNMLTLGGSTTSVVYVNNNLNVASGNEYQINGTSVLSSDTLGNGVINSSLTQVGALSSGSIASGFGTIATANTITGTTLNGTTGINTGSGAGTQRIDTNGNLSANYATVSASLALGTSNASAGPGNLDMSGNLTTSGTTKFGGQTYTWPGSQTINGYLQTDGTGGLSWTTNITATSLSFSGLTSGTNTQAAMTVGNGASLGYTGTGTIDASSLEGATWEAPGTIGSATPNTGAFTSVTTPTIIGSTSLALKPASDSTTAIQLQNAAGGSILNVDTTNGFVGIGTTSPVAKLDVNGDLNVSGYATASASLALGTANASAGPGNLDMSGNLTAGGNITGTTLNGTTGINTGSGAGTQRIDASGNLSANYATVSASLALGTANASAGPGNLDMSGNLTTGGTISLPNGNTLTGISNFIELNNGLAVGNGTTYYFDKNGNINANTIATGAIQRIDASGNLTNIGTTQFNGITYTWPLPINQPANGYLQTDGSGGLSWTTNIVATSMPFSGLTSATNTQAAMVVGSGASLEYTGTGTINASSLEGATWEAPGTIGSATPNSGVFTSMNLTTGNSYYINNVSVLSATTLGSGVINSSLTQVGALSSGSIASGFGTIATANTITGTTLNGTAGINTGAGAGTQRIDDSGNLTNIGDITASGTINFSDLTASKVVFTDVSKNLTSTGTVGVDQGGTGITSYTIGDILYADTTSSLTTLADAATGQVLKAGGVGATPGWGQVILGTDTSGNYVSTITGTANQITSSGSIGDITLSIPSDFRAPGTVNAVNGLYTGPTAGTLRIDASGNLSANYATVSASLALGTSNASAGPGNLDMSGNLTTGGTTTFGGQTYTWPALIGSNNYILQTQTNGTLAWVDPALAIAGSIYWTAGNGAIYPKNNTYDILFGATAGSTATTSAKFAFTGINGGLPTASIAGTPASNVATYLTGNGNLATTNMADLTLGGSSTGNVIINSRGNTALTASGSNLTTGNNVTVGGIAYFANGTTYYVDASGNANLNAGTFTGNVNLLTGNVYNINNISVLSATTLGTNVINSSLTQVGALSSGSIASGFGTIATANTITGTTVNGTTGINTGSGAGTQRIDANGNLSANYATVSASLALGSSNASAGPGNLDMSGNLTTSGTTKFGGQIYTWPGSQTVNGFLQTNGSGTLSWTTSLPSGTTISFTNLTNGTNISAAMTVGSGASLTYSGTGTINASSLGGNTWAAPGAIGSGTPNAGTFTSLNASGTVNLSGLTASKAVFTDASKNLTSTGTVGVGQGGTGLTSYTIGDLLNANSTSTLASLADVAAGNVLLSGGVGSAPLYGKVALGTHTTGNYVSTITGTANQITSSASTGDITLSIPADFRAPGTVNAVNGIYTGATAGTQRIDASGNLTNIGTTQLHGITYTWPGSDAAGSGYVLSSNGAGTLSWAAAATGSQWTQSAVNGVLYPSSNTVDVLIGGSATTSAKFAFTGVDGGLPTASIAGTVGSNVATYLTGNGNLATTNMADLTLGGSSTGNVNINSRGSNALIANGANLTAGGTLTFPNSNTLTGVSSYLELSQGVSVGAGTNYYFSSTGLLNASKLQVSGIADVVQAYIKAYSTQTNHIQEWQNSGGTALSWIDGQGNLRVGSGAVDNGSLLDVAGAPTSDALAIFNTTGGTQNIIAASASGATKMTLDQNGVLSLYNSTSSITNTAGDITIGAASGNINFSGDTIQNINTVNAGSGIFSNVLQVNSTGALQAYSRFGNGTSSHGLVSPQDVYITGKLDVGGVFYLSSNEIGNGTNGTPAIILSSAPTTTANTLTAGNWLVENNANLGQATLMVNQTMGGDIFTASASGTPKFVIANSGNVGIGTVSPTALLDVSANSTNTASDYTTLKLEGSQSTANTGTFYGENIIPAFTASSGNTLANLKALVSNPQVTSTGTVTNAYNIYSRLDNTSTGTISNLYDLYLAAPGNTSGTITHKYALVTEAGAGNVGIGTTSPGGALDDAGGSLFLSNATSNLISFGNSGVAVPGAGSAGEKIQLFGATRGTVATADYALGVQSSNMWFNTDGGYMFYKDAAATPEVILDTNGNVGIGTTSTITPLTLGQNPSDLGGLSFQNTTGQANSRNWNIRDDVTAFGDLAIRQSTTQNGTTFATRLTIDPNGNVGIGATSPAANLTVAKNFNTTPTALTPSASVAVDCSLANVFTLTPGQAESITASNMVAGQYVDLIILTSGTNSYTLTFSTGFKTPNTTLATGTVTGKYFAIHYISNGSYLIEIGRTSTQTAVGADIAEWYSYAGEKPQPGEIVSISADNTQIEKTDQAYSQQISGVVSTQPAITLGQEPDQGIVMALTGRVPLKVSTKNGQILTGDSITSSTIAGVGMKAVKAGQTVGKALESTNNWTTQSCPAVASLDQINWPDDDGTNPNHPCFTLSDGTMIGKIMVFVNPSWYDPEVYLTDTGNLKIAQVNGNYQLTNTSNSNSVIDTIGAFANVVAANIKAGAITTTDFIAQNITAGAVTTQSLATNSFTAFQGTVDNLLVKSGLVAFNIQTQLISPVPGQTNVAVQIGSEATPSGQFVIQNASGSAVAAIDNLGNATISGQLTTNGASVSGTLYADNIQSKSLDDIQALLTQVETDQNTLKNTVNWNSLTATNSANLDNLAVSDLYITNQAAINSLSVTTSIALGSDLVIGSDNTINTLSAPLKIQSLAMAPVEIMDGLVTIDTKGNVNIAGDLAVAGRVKAAGLDITAAQMTDPNATTSANLLTLQDASGNTVSSVNSSGSAQFNSITTPQLIVAGSADATVAGTIVNGVITTNSTIGTATIPAGTADITIKNPKISDYTLVYVTPTSGTQNNVLYVKEKGTGYFKVGFDQAINTDVSFNWWIVQVSQ